MKFVIILILVGSACLSNASSSSSSSESSSSSSSSESSSSHHSRKVKYSYTIWIGDDVNNEYTMQLKSKPDCKFIEAMRQAAAKNKRFKFQQTIHPVYGVLIHELCGVPNDKATGQYWMLFDLTSKPDIKNKPCNHLQSTVGVDELKIEPYHYYLFWYKSNNGVCG